MSNFCVKWLDQLVSKSQEGRGVLDLIDMSGNLLEAALEGGTVSYINAFKRERNRRGFLYQDGPFEYPHYLRDSSVHESRQRFLTAPNAEELRKIVSLIIDGLQHISRNQEKTSNNLKQLFIKIVSLAFLRVKNLQEWNPLLESQLLESFKNKENFSRVMTEICKDLCDPKFHNFFPQEFHTIVNSSEWKKWINDAPDEFKKDWFYPVLVQSGYVQNIANKDLSIEEREEAFDAIDFLKLPVEVRPKLAKNSSIRTIIKKKSDQGVPDYTLLFERTKPSFFKKSLKSFSSISACRLIIMLPGNTEGVRHLLLSLSAADLNNVLNDEKLWNRLESRRIRLLDSLKKSTEPYINITRKEICEQDALILFLKIMRIHSRLVESTFREKTESKIDDFKMILQEMWCPQYAGIQPVESDIKHNLLSPTRLPSASYESLRKNLILFAETAGSFAAEGDLRLFLKRHGTHSNVRVMEKAVGWYMDYLSFLNTQEPNLGEEEIIRKLDEIFLISNSAPQLQRIKPTTQMPTAYPLLDSSSSNSNDIAHVQGGKNVEPTAPPLTPTNYSYSSSFHTPQRNRTQPIKIPNATNPTAHTKQYDSFYSYSPESVTNIDFYENELRQQQGKHTPPPHHLSDLFQPEPKAIPVVKGNNDVVNVDSYNVYSGKKNGPGST